jgi:hypothetical protein
MAMPDDAHDGMLDLFELLDDANLFDNTLYSNELNLSDVGAVHHHDHGKQQQLSSQLQSVAQHPLCIPQQANGPAMDVGRPSGLSMDAAWQLATNQQQWDSSNGYAVGPTVFTSPDAASKYADTAALVAAAQAQMDAASPGHGAAGLQLQHVVSAASLQLQQMVQRQAMFASKAPAQTVGTGYTANNLHQTQDMQQMQQPAQTQHMQHSQPMLLQQQAQQQQQAQAQQLFQQQFQQQQQPTAATPFGMQPAQQHKQAQAQAQAPQQMRNKPAFSASTMAKAAAIAGQAGVQQPQMPAPAPRAPSYNLGHMPAQPMTSARTSLAPAGSAPGLQADAAAGFFQRPASLTGGLDCASAAAATAAIAAQQQGLGLALPDQFKGVMLTPAGAVTGVLCWPVL